MSDKNVVAAASDDHGKARTLRERMSADLQLRGMAQADAGWLPPRSSQAGCLLQHRPRSVHRTTSR